MKYKVFKNKNCFITGATGGIGKEISKKMAANQCNLFLTSTNREKLHLLKEELGSLYGKNINIFYEQGDLEKLQDIDNLIAMARESLGRIDIIVNCAGRFIVKRLSDFNVKDFEAIINLNVRVLFILCREFSKDMIKNGWGRIINIGSSSAYTGSKETSLYSASKHAVLGFSRALHNELKEHNIRTFCVSPAGVKTEMGRKIKNQKFDTFLDPVEISEYVVFICSFDNDLISEEIRLNRIIIE